MPNGYEMEDLESLVGMLETDESDESDESDEAEPRWRRRRPRTASGRGLYSPRPQQNYVTQAQLQTALAKVGEQIKVNSAAIGTLTNRVNTVTSEQTKQAAAVKKEVADRKKETDALRKDFRQKLELLTLLPLISRPRSEEITVPTPNQGTRNIRVLVDSGDTFSLLLPMLLVGGLGGGSGLGGSGSDSSSDSSTPLLLLLALSGGLGR